eukprot:COSAG04_NODE_1126_length_8142_cov_88.507646_1_plen_93_part_00
MRPRSRLLLALTLLQPAASEVGEMEVKAAQVRMAIHSEDCYLGKVVYMLQEEPSLARMIDRNCTPYRGRRWRPRSAGVAGAPAPLAPPRRSH